MCHRTALRMDKTKFHMKNMIFSKHLKDFVVDYWFFLNLKKKLNIFLWKNVSPYKIYSKINIYYKKIENFCKCRFTRFSLKNSRYSVKFHIFLYQFYWSYSFLTISRSQKHKNKKRTLKLIRFLICLKTKIWNTFYKLFNTDDYFYFYRSIIPF